MRRFVPLSTVTVPGAGTACAQHTGPTQPPATPPRTTDSGLTPEKVVAELRKRGHQVQERADHDGLKQYRVAIRRDGWAFIVELGCSGDGTMLVLRAPLPTPGGNLSAAQMLELLKQNAHNKPLFFSYEEATRRLVLNLVFVRTTFKDETVVATCLDLFIGVIRDTYKVWDASRYPPLTPTVPTPAVLRFPTGVR